MMQGMSHFVRHDGLLSSSFRMQRSGMRNPLVQQVGDFSSLPLVARRNDGLYYNSSFRAKQSGARNPLVIKKKNSPFPHFQILKSPLLLLHQCASAAVN